MEQMTDDQLKMHVRALQGEGATLYAACEAAKFTIQSLEPLLDGPDSMPHRASVERARRELQRAETRGERLDEEIHEANAELARRSKRTLTDRDRSEWRDILILAGHSRKLAAELDETIARAGTLLSEIFQTAMHSHTLACRYLPPGTAEAYGPTHEPLAMAAIAGLFRAAGLPIMLDELGPRFRSNPNVGPAIEIVAARAARLEQRCPDLELMRKLKEELRPKSHLFQKGVCPNPNGRRGKNREGTVSQP